MDAAIIWDEAYAEHDTGAHPEGADRITTVVRHLEGTDLWRRLRVFTAPEPATEEDILRVHTQGHLALIKRAAQGKGTWLDPDTHVSPRSYEIALLSAGGALLATDLWEQGLVPFALIRPPGHHATPDRAMGFCLFNNIAIAAARLLERGVERVAILDWDVHHGNGTNDIFHADPRVLYASIHQSPLYPGTGALSDRGSGAGWGCTLNLPVPAGSGDDVFCAMVDHVAVPWARTRAPELVLLSAGYDAHADDPLASCAVTEAGFAAMAASVHRLAAEVGAPVGLVLEGGYDLGALARSLAATLETLASDRVEPDAAPEHPLALAAAERLAAVEPL
jgi:acetoin utilization deacetylase AcuC-like enzyme